jgi:opacity protein-like surface antigen
MKKFLLVALLMLSFSMIAVAQGVPLAEIYGGYSYLRCGVDVKDFECKLHGWDASLAINGNKWLGLVVDFGGNYGTVEDTTEIHAHSFLLGPKVSIRKGRVAPFLQGMIGFANVRIGEGSSKSQTNDFAMAFGGGLDISVNDKVAIRPFQLEYFGIKEPLTGEITDNIRVSAGVVVKLGKR